MRGMGRTDLRADLARWREQFDDATPMADLVERREQTVVGVVQRIRVVPRTSITVRLSDGTERTFTLEQAPGRNQAFDLGGAESESLLLRIDSIFEREGNQGNVGGWMQLQILTGNP